MNNSFQENKYLETNLRDALYSPRLTISTVMTYLAKTVFNKLIVDIINKLEFRFRNFTRYYSVLII